MSSVLVLCLLFWSFPSALSLGMDHPVSQTQSRGSSHSVKTHSSRRPVAAASCDLCLEGLPARASVTQPSAVSLLWAHRTKGLCASADARGICLDSAPLCFAAAPQCPCVSGSQGKEAPCPCAYPPCTHPLAARPCINHPYVFMDTPRHGPQH